MVEARAVHIREPGDADVLEIGPLELRDPGPGEILVEVAAAGLNRADVVQRRGRYPAPPGVAPDVPGLEYAGTVAALGEGVTTFAPGDRVMGITGGGGMATHLVVHEREALPVPPGLELPAAAAVPEAFLTAYDALFVQAGLQMGEVALLHAVGSGIGTAGLQLVRVAGARAVGTSRSPDKLERCRELGLPDGIVVQEGRFAGELKRLTGGRLADVILDTIGGAYLAENVASLATGGRMVTIGLLGGAKAELPLGALMTKRARIAGSVLRSRSLEQKATLAQRFIHEVLPLFGSGQLTPVVDQVMPMQDIAEAHRRMERNETFAKIVMTW